MQKDDEDKKSTLSIGDDTMRAHRVAVYLNNLKDRLKDLRQQHDQVIQNSVDIIKEINEVSGTICLKSGNDKIGSMTKIKRLIMEFESSSLAAKKSSTSINKDSSSYDIHKLLQNFENLNDSQLLRESLLYFKQAKESFERIDTFLDKMNEHGSPENVISRQMPSQMVVQSSSLREKINMFNNKAAEGHESSSKFVSCFSSVTSLDEYKSLENVKQANDGSITGSMGQSGYEGDVDSEVEVNECEK